jgi:hypothetical protein
VTRAQLRRLRAANALPHTLRYDQLAPYHVPFDELAETTAVEGELAHWLARGGRVALIGASGSGKSSALAWALAHKAPENLAALRIPIALADDDTVQTTEGFARHVIRRVIAAARLGESEASELRSRAADTVHRRTRETRRSRRLGLRAGMLSGELARELTQSGAEFDEQIGAGEVVEGLQRLVELFRARDTDPLLILDDSDTWIARPHDEHPARLAEAFFARNVRMLASEIDCGFVVAVHTTYLDFPAYQEIAARLERIRVPQLARPNVDLARILARRLEVAGLDIALQDIFEPEALATLAGIYEDLPDVRRAIATAATSIRLALEEPEFDRVTPAAVRAAAAESADDASGS